MQPLIEMAGNRLWKWQATALCNLAKLPKTICNRLWKWQATALCNLAKLPKTICNRFRQPLMEMVLALPKSLEPLHLFSRKASQYQ
jgi:hypothetical protein